MEDLVTKHEGGNNTYNDINNNKMMIRARPSTCTTSPWPRSKDPRIVRVSRAFGGKDRHSKVCTVRGLRDRRVRLSVPTALQLYDLQHRLGLNQPSKVVDWLLNVAKDEIDELPPLQIPPGLFFPQNLEGLMTINASKEMVEANIGNIEERGESSESLDGLMNNSNNTNSMTYNNSLLRWDASNLLSLSHASQPPEDRYHINYMPTGLSQLYNPSQGSAHSYFSSNNNVCDEEFDQNKHIGFQMLSTNSLHHHHQSSQHHQEQNIRPFHFSMMAPSEPTKESEYDSSR